MLSWIDTHVHLFTPAESTPDKTPPFVQDGNVLHTTAVYLKALGEQKPAGVVVVDFSKSTSSAHVMNSMPELESAGIPARGIIKAIPGDDQTLEWLKDDRVLGVRLYCKDGVPNLGADKSWWDGMFNQLRHGGKHVLAFGSCKYLPGLIAQIPSDITVVIDHLGMPDAFKGASDPAFKKLVLDMASRHKNAGKVYFKGPGYRTAMDVRKVQPFVTEILRIFGNRQLMLGASDGPFAGPVLDSSPQFRDKKFGEVLTYAKVLQFTKYLAQHAAEELGRNAGELEKAVFHDNAARLYRF